MTQILEFFGFILELIVDFQFYKDRKKRRQFEKENNLPKKIMIHPTIKITFWSITVIIILGVLLSLYKYYFSNDEKTSKKISQIESLIIENKKVNGYYPKNLEDIIRNNPLRKNITLDSWGNEFYYEVLENNNSFTLISKGKDGILNTEDDIKRLAT